MNPYSKVFLKQQPTVDQVHVNRALSNISIAFQQEQVDFVADKVFPIVPVQQQSNIYYKHRRADWMRSEAQVRGPASESAGTGWNIDQDQYACLKYSVHHDIPDEVNANTDPALSNMPAIGAELVTEQLLIRREIIFLSEFLAAGVWGVDTTPSTLWSATGSTPIADIRAQIVAMRARTGRRPNQITMSPNVWSVLEDHPDILNRVNQGQTSGPAIVEPSALGRILQIPQINVAWGVSNSAVEGAAEAIDFIVGDHLLLSYSPPNPSLMTPAAGYIFAWTGLLGGNAYGGAMRNYRMEHLAAERIEGDMAFATKIVSPELGTFFDTPI